MRFPIANVTIILILIVVGQDCNAGPFDRFRERLRQLRGEAPAAAPVTPAPVTPAPVTPAPVTPAPAPVAQVPPPAPVVPTFDSASLGDTIWRGILSLSTSEIAHFKNNQKQQYSVNNPSVSAIVEIWFPSSTTWFCVIDLTDARSSSEDGDGIYAPNKRKWEPLIGTAPDGLVGDELPLDGYVGSGALNHATQKFEGGRDNDVNDPDNNPECLILINGSYSFGGTTSQPTLIITGASTALPSKEEGVRIVSTVTGSGTFQLTDRKVSQEKNLPGGFSDLPEQE